MKREMRSNLAIGLLLILLGIWFLLVQIFPGIKEMINIPFTWPLIVVAVGVFLLLLGLILRVPELAVPACIVGGIGVLLYWQNTMGNWTSWAYTWTLIPGFVGVGVILSGLLSGEYRSGFRSGFRLILTSLVLFVLFWLFLGSGLSLQYWPLLLVILGIWTLIEALFRRK